MEIVISGSGSSVCGAMLGKMKVVTVLRRQVAMSLSQDMFFSSQNAPEGTDHPVATLHGQKAQTKVRGRAIPSRISEVWVNSKTNKLPRSFTGLIQIQSVKTATSLSFNALVGYLVHVL